MANKRTAKVDMEKMKTSKWEVFWGWGWEQSPGHSTQPDVSRGPYGATKSGWRALISPRSVHEGRRAEFMQKPESTPDVLINLNARMSNLLKIRNI